MNVVQIPRRFVREEWGGTETVIFETSKRLLQMGHRTEVLCSMALSEHDREEIGTVHVRRVPYFYPYLGLTREEKLKLDKKGGNLFSFALLKCLKEYPDLDLIHLYTTKRMGGIGRYVARKRKIPYIVSLQGGALDVPPEEASSWTAPTRGKLEWGKILGWWVGSRRVLEDAAAILCVGRAEQEALERRLPHQKVIYLPNGVDTARFASGDGALFRRNRGISPQAKVVLVMGRFDVQKNQLLAVESLYRLRERGVDAHLLMIGHVTSPSYYDKVVAAIEERGLKNFTTLVPGLAPDSRELSDAYHAADVFLLPSIHEPFGIVILEAWAAGLPVVASRVGGVPSFVEHGRNGMLCPSGDTEAFAGALEQILRDRQLAEDIARAGREKAGEYQWDNLAARLAEIYREAIEAKRRSG